MSKIISFLDRISKHKCLVVIIITTLFVCFIDSNSIWERHYRWQSISQMKAEINEMKASYEDNTQQLERLKSDPSRVEQIARERYYMTRDDEDLFIIQHDGETTNVNVMNEDEDDSEPEV